MPLHTRSRNVRDSGVIQGLANSVSVIPALARKSWCGGLSDHVISSGPSKALLNPLHFGASPMIIDKFSFPLRAALIDAGLGSSTSYQKIRMWQPARRGIRRYEYSSPQF